MGCKKKKKEKKTGLGLCVKDTARAPIIAFWKEKKRNGWTRLVDDMKNPTLFVDRRMNEGCAFFFFLFFVFVEGQSMNGPLVLFWYRVSVSRHFDHKVIHDCREKGGKEGAANFFSQVLLVFPLLPSICVKQKMKVFLVKEWEFIKLKRVDNIFRFEQMEL